jgi:hypothetical protein
MFAWDARNSVSAADIPSVERGRLERPLHLARIEIERQNRIKMVIREIETFSAVRLRTRILARGDEALQVFWRGSKIISGADEDRSGLPIDRKRTSPNRRPLESGLKSRIRNRVGLPEDLHRR